MSTYNDALKFWNQVFEMDDETKKKYMVEIDSEKDWKDLASSEKLRDVIIEKLSNKERVLDYGCGEGWAGITTENASVVIAMNYYMEPVSMPEKNMEVRNDNELYINGILRMVTRTDEEWSEIFSKYFDVKEIIYFSWPGEKEEKRRIFILNNK